MELEARRRKNIVEISTEINSMERIHASATHTHTQREVSVKSELVLVKGQWDLTNLGLDCSTKIKKKEENQLPKLEGKKGVQVNPYKN